MLSQNLLARRSSCSIKVQLHQFYLILAYLWVYKLHFLYITSACGHKPNHSHRISPYLSLLYTHLSLALSWLGFPHFLIIWSLYLLYYISAQSDSISDLRRSLWRLAINVEKLELCLTPPNGVAYLNPLAQHWCLVTLL